MAFLKISRSSKVIIHDLGTLTLNHGISSQGSGAAKTHVINDERFSKKGLEDRNDPQPDPSVQPKARGLLHMEREYIAHHIKRKNSGLEHLIASIQPRKYSEDYPKRSANSKSGQWTPEASKSTR